MKTRAVLAALPLLLVAACGSTGSGTPTTSTTASSPASPTPTSPAATLGPELPPATAVAEALDPARMPTASGSFGDKPTITFPDGDPAPSLQRIVLSEGDGPEASEGDMVVVDYYGVVWGESEPFDNSYDKGAPFNFTIGSGVVNGWSVGLEGVKGGSRVLLSLPPEDGYGAAGSGPNIPGGATLVFVVDVLAVYTDDSHAEEDAAPQEQDPTLPQIEGPMTEEPVISMPEGVQPPTEIKAELINEGTGEAVEAGDSIVVQWVFRDWAGTQVQSTWPTDENLAAGFGDGPQLLPISAATDGGTPTADASDPTPALIGMPVGSRVLLLLPGETDATGASVGATIVVLDILGTI